MKAGAPTMTWDSAGIAESNRYFVTKATRLIDSVWTPVSGEILDSGVETNWTDSDLGSGFIYSRIEAAPR